MNLSARCLPDTTLPSKVAQLLDQTGVPAERLDIEITETAMMSNPGQAIAVLRELAALGIRISVDDYGTGYSSMAYLKHLPVREIKIDRTFVTDMAGDNSDYTIVRSSIELARQLGLDVVAEGVETADALAQLTELDCTTVQGYYFSKPLPPDELWRWLAAWPGNDRRPQRQEQVAF